MSNHDLDVKRQELAKIQSEIDQYTQQRDIADNQQDINAAQSEINSLKQQESSLTNEIMEITVNEAMQSGDLEGLHNVSMHGSLDGTQGVEQTSQEVINNSEAEKPEMYRAIAELGEVERGNMEKKGIEIGAGRGGMSSGGPHPERLATDSPEVMAENHQFTQDFKNSVAELETSMFADNDTYNIGSALERNNHSTGAGVEAGVDRDANRGIDDASSGNDTPEPSAER